ncbi:hypothetical protein ACFX2C_017061 [Malus domestica]
MQGRKFQKLRDFSRLPQPSPCAENGYGNVSIGLGLLVLMGLTSYAHSIYKLQPIQKKPNKQTEVLLLPCSFHQQPRNSILRLVLRKPSVGEPFWWALSGWIFEAQVEMVVMISARLHTVTSALPSGRDCKYTGQAVKALPIRIISVGKKRSQGVQLVVDEYIEKLKLYCSVDDVHIRNNPKNAHDSKAQVDHEDSAVMDLIRSNDWVVLLDERGKDIGSEQMAELVGDAGNTGASRLSFCVGGPYGHGKRLRERADVSIKLSSMVLNHQIALVVLVEQLYRAWTILKGQNYHR